MVLFSCSYFLVFKLSYTYFDDFYCFLIFCLEVYDRQTLTPYVFYSFTPGLTVYSRFNRFWSFWMIMNSVWSLRTSSRTHFQFMDCFTKLFTRQKYVISILSYLWWKRRRWFVTFSWCCVCWESKHIQGEVNLVAW